MVRGEVGSRDESDEEHDREEADGQDDLEKREEPVPPPQQQALPQKQQQVAPGTSLATFSFPCGGPEHAHIFFLYQFPE